MDPTRASIPSGTSIPLFGASSSPSTLDPGSFNAQPLGASLYRRHTRTPRRSEHPCLLLTPDVVLAIGAPPKPDDTTEKCQRDCDPERGRSLRVVGGGATARGARLSFVVGRDIVGWVKRADRLDVVGREPAGGHLSLIAALVIAVAVARPHVRQGRDGMVETDVVAGLVGDHRLKIGPGLVVLLRREALLAGVDLHVGVREEAAVFEVV